MTPSELKRLTRKTEPHFFTRSNMGFMGDTMRNYGVRRAKARIAGRDCWELYRKKPNKLGLRDSAYFDVETYEQVYPGEWYING